MEKTKLAFILFVKRAISQTLELLGCSIVLIVFISSGRLNNCISLIKPKTKPMFMIKPVYSISAFLWIVLFDRKLEISSIRYPGYQSRIYVSLYQIPIHITMATCDKVDQISQINIFP